MKKNLASLFGIFILIGLISCGQVVTETVNESENEEATLSTILSQIYIFATDYASSGQLYTANLDSENNLSLTNSGMSLLGSSAIIRNFGTRLYILHDGFSLFSSDNVQIVDLENDFQTLEQFSVGNGTNPKDIAVSGDRGFVTLYNPTGQEDNVDENGNPGDVIEIDLNTGEIKKRWSFLDFLTDDGDKNAHADQLILIGNKLYVTLQDLESNTFAATAPGKIGIINIETQEIEGIIELEGRNPVDLVASMDGGTLFVINMATFNVDIENFDISEDFGGIEVIDLTNLESERLIADNDFDGYTERAQVSENFLYVVVSHFDPDEFKFFSKVVALSLDDYSNETIDDEGTDIREIFLDDDFLWISRRQIDTNTGLSEPRIDVLDLATDKLLDNNLKPVAPGMSLAEGL